MTNPDQDVTLDEMALEVIKWVSDGLHWVDDSNRIRGKGPLLRKKPSDLYTSLDVIREVEEELRKNHEETEHWSDADPRLFTMYLEKRQKLAIKESDQYNDGRFPHGLNLIPGRNSNYDGWLCKFHNHDAETRLRAIFATLRESGEI